jgi:hypothetical protein
LGSPPPYVLYVLVIYAADLTYDYKTFEEHRQAGFDTRPHTSHTLLKGANMIGTSRLEFYFIRFCIIGLHYLAPTCILYCLLVISLYGTKAAFYRVPLIIESTAIAETLFYLLVYLPYRFHLQREAVHPPAPTRQERKELFKLCNDNISDPEVYLQKWFLGAGIDEIKRENLKEFFLWAFFNRGGPPGNDDEELEEYVVATEKLLGRPIQQGRGDATCLRLTLDRVEMLHRSLIWYFVSTPINSLYVSRQPAYINTYASVLDLWIF